MFEDCRNQWSMSRPLLPLILLNNEYFHQLRQQIISQQAPDKQNAMSQWFDNLMEGIEPNLLTKNRDKFTQNLSVFRRDINESLKAPISSASSSSSSTNNSSGSVNVGGNEMITS
ncbi:Exportin-7-A [Armadillidium nasatum]|uniref:Exportin-7-A n=1 Tax=Armadillidium nasatum TaxID=96803 RepID=A0A5N5TDM4_9CRUS|nr:Exportin-7-A [Armadillidium nasatum]